MLLLRGNINQSLDRVLAGARDNHVAIPQKLALGTVHTGYCFVLEDSKLSLILSHNWPNKERVS